MPTFNVNRGIIFLVFKGINYVVKAIKLLFNGLVLLMNFLNLRVNGTLIFIWPIENCISRCNQSNYCDELPKFHTVFVNFLFPCLYAIYVILCIFLTKHLDEDY